MRDLPPGPREPAALQTVEWIVRPTALLRRAQARYGEPFTLRTAWIDAPLVLTSDPGEIKRIYAAAPDVLQAGDSSSILEPFVGRNSVLILSGDEHLRQRRLMLPPFHGEALKRHKETIAEITHAELDTWPAGTVLKTLPRMQRITLEVIQRVIFGSRDGELRDALRHALDMTGSMPNLVAMSLFGPHKRFTKAVERIDELVYARIDQPGQGDSILDMLKASGATREELRDELVTLLVAGHETTATALAWALERLARHPAAWARLREEVAAGEEEYLDAVVKETLRLRPVIPIVLRHLKAPMRIGGWDLPAGVSVVPCIYLVHRDPTVYPDPLAFRPERFIESPAGTYTWIPFGGGVRRCLGASFALFEMKTVLRVIAARARLRAEDPAPAPTTRRAITLVPADDARVLVG
jgi:cytochrome P450 family 135